MVPSTRAAGSVTPTERDIEEYRRVRNASRDLHAKIQKTVPREVTLEVAGLLNLMGKDGVLVLPYEGAADVLIEACLYGWTQEGRNLVQEFARRYAEIGKPTWANGRRPPWRRRRGPRIAWSSSTRSLPGPESA